MVLEATMILIDNSEYMRNGDYQPTRFGAQTDAVSIIFGTKTQSNPENTVGIMTFAGKSPEVLVTPTQDMGKILSALHSLKIDGQVDLATGVQVAQLALKHRQNKNQRQRIIVFLGSPLSVDEKSLVKLGKKLKKNNVAIDVVSFGEEEENDGRLRTLVDTVSSGDNSHLLSVPAGPHLLSDALVSSAILAGEDGVVADVDGAGPAAASGSFEFGVDPSLDPELAMALRMSLEEERARQTASGSEPAPAAAAAAVSALTTVPESAAAPDTVMGVEDDDDAELAQALALSQGEDVDMADEQDLDEQEEIARAIAMSMNEDEAKGKEAK